MNACERCNRGVGHLTTPAGTLVCSKCARLLRHLYPLWTIGRAAAVVLPQPTDDQRDDLLSKQP